jgi:amino acid transporter
MSITTPRRATSGEVVKRLLLGRALASYKQEHQLLPKLLALPVFSSDALSSVAYATEEMMLVLIAAGASALAYTLPIAIAIAALMVVVVTSYRQTVRAYPQGGGSYIVARENLGTIPGLVAAAAILTDYALTVAVSITAGTIAITSAAPGLADHKVALALVLVALITLVNLRGVKEAGTFFAFPTYGFIAMVFLTLVVGLARCVGGCPAAATSSLSLEQQTGLTIFLLLKAFASGATALTGVEAIADGVPAFRRPQARNAAATLAVMATISISMFLGITVLARLLDVRVTHEIAASRSVLAQIGQSVFGERAPLFYALQIFTAGILVLAANTSFQDFPRLSSILARDRFMPSQFRNRGDRLVFSNGVLVLASLAAVLIYAFDANLTHLIQLYVVGVFTAFTLSQLGMVRRWQRLRGEGWRRSAVINGVGATATGVVLVIVTITKFRGGAWIVIVAIPLIVAFFVLVHRHYTRVGEILHSSRLSPRSEPGNAFLLLVPDLGPATTDAVAYLRAVRPERLMPLFVGSPEEFADASAEWSSRFPRLGRLDLLEGADDHLVRTLRRYVRSHQTNDDDFVTVVIPEALTGRSWVQFVRNRGALLLKTGLLFEPGIVVTDVPLVPEERATAEARRDRPVEPGRHVVLVPVSGVHDATVRAIAYAKSLRPSEIRAIFFTTDPDEAVAVVEGWHERKIDVPLTLVEAPFRDIGPPLLDEVDDLLARRDTVVTVVLPELIPAHWWENALHNQTAFYIKRLLLFEPSVVVTSVPFHLGAAPAVAPRVASRQ